MDAQNAAHQHPETTSEPAPSRPIASTSSATATTAGDAPEDRDSDAETIVLPGKDGHSPSKVRKPSNKTSGSHDADKPVATNRLVDAVKKKRFKDASSGLSSAPTPPRTMLRDKLKSGERLLPHKRKGDTRKEPKELKSVSSKPHHDSRISSQLPSHSSNGLAPLQPTDYHSDDSSASGSPHPRSSKLRGLAAPSTAESNASPAKMAPHKKHLDAHGEYDERPEDLNVADYAGNTPLQIAAINGCEDIVKLLIDAGCNLDYAVDNVNPRKANVNGEEPLDRIRAALVEAKKRFDRHSHHDYHETRDSHAPDSPRRSPATLPGTVRATKTRNDLLYMPLDEKTLRQAAGRVDDPESMVAAARASPDPAPIKNMQPDNIKGFDPTRLARRRQGTNWKEEEQMLKNAYDESPRREREREREREERDAKRARRAERNHSSPSGETELKRKASSSKLPSPKERRKSDAPNYKDEAPAKRGPGRPRKEDRILPSIQLKTKRVEPDAAAVKPRRKLVSKGELRGEREKKRRANHPPNLPDKHRSDKLSEKYHDRTKAIKRDESRDRPALSTDGSSKRHRSSTPDRPSNGDKDDSEVAIKRRRLDAEGKEKRQKRSLSDERPRKSSNPQDSSKLASKPSQKNLDEDRREARHSLNRGDSMRSSSSSEKQIHVKHEEDLEMKDVQSIKPVEEADIKAAREKEALEKQRLREQEEARRKKQQQQEEEERKRVEAEEKRRLEEEARRKAEEEERRRKEEEEKKRREEEEQREAERKRKEEEERKRQEEEERQRREAEEKARREEEEKRRLEEEKQKKEEEERRQREEEERLRQEQLEREAAEEARRQREEEERKERERRERAHREEMERKRAAREAELRRIREEQEKARLDKLPPLLRWLDTCPNPKLSSVAERFKRMQGVRYDTIQPEANKTPEGREQWVLNTHVALLLGEKDLDLSRYTAWERVSVSPLAKKSLWRVEWKLYSLVSEKLWDLGRQLPDYYGDEDPCSLGFQTKERLKREAWERFLNTDMFFVKVSDLMYTVPNIPHLRNIQLAVEYRELMETEAQGLCWKASQKWKSDPDASRYHGFAPRSKYYIDGQMVGEDLPSLHQTSNVPFPEKRVPRRGLLQVYPDDPEYVRICLEQGLEHLVNDHSSPLANGIHSSPISQKSVTPAGSIANGTSKTLAALSTTNDSAATNGALTNGLNGSMT
ncbi:hypothetical protein BGZ63DRAFT_411124 [Mariannaea sp. PMI_226]|nr:hypothetical protein BGZ63DRAFT_411124 [Mariannaea sp. PMI_226]